MEQCGNAIYEIGFRKFATVNAKRYQCCTSEEKRKIWDMGEL